MLDEVEQAAFVLVVCTETYHERFRGNTPPGTGRGVKWEGAVITVHRHSTRGLRFDAARISLAEVIATEAGNGN